ncbi:peptidylprolyl isomerase [Tateyamaria sp. ANG-S1]|uniref:peptidylprolyl isomerase n=1 Tax=Tateyamaria sp. ANG-S1 TaxID=1577905 RepID=UPI00057E464F|nr:peptidylprolyl isomerase [Tateyamaria sp. ANG-S1]KIC49217.1 peptidylprolyl isomerase [Tateyamaria sp. ANG-S1]
MAQGKTSISKIAVWILLGLLFVGLSLGFGLDGLGGTIRTVGKVGDKHIDVQTYADTLQREMQAVGQQTGQPLTFARAQAIGLDQAVLAQLVRARALDYEAGQMGLSVGDEVIRDEILNIPAFRGLDGSFDRDAYRFALDQQGTSEADFETTLREEVSRSILQGAIVSGVQMPDTYARTLVSFLGETRDFTWVRLGQADLETDLPDPTDDVLRAYYEDNLADYELPETKRITYAVLLPDMIVDSMDVDEEMLRAEYEARADQYNQPERRLVERLVYLDAEAADRAAAQLEVDGTTFEALVAERGLDLGDIDMGDVTRLQLDAAGEAVFAADVGDVVGPLPSSLGPALFRVNAVLPAQTISFEDAKPELQQELSMAAARRQVEVLAEEFDNMLAGGATLEELDAETDMRLGTIDWYPALGEGLAAYDGFRDAAAELTQDDFPEIVQLDEGGIFAMRMDDLLPPRPAPFEEAKLNVQGNWEAEQSEARLTEKAEALLPALEAGESFASQSLDSIVETDLDRGAFVQGTPPEFMTSVFEMEPGDVRVIPGYGAVLIVRLDGINPIEDSPEVQAETEALSAEMGQIVAGEIFNIFGEDVVLRAGTQINQQALDAVHVNFP